jgi:hypothetical protein
MRRSVLAFDRIVVLLLGVALVILGLAAIGWQAGFLQRIWPGAPDVLHVDTAKITGKPNFAPIAAAAGVLLILAGLGWLLAHVPRRGVGPLRLPPTGLPGRLTVEPNAAVATAADVLAEDPTVDSASGAVLTDRGQLVVRLRAAVDPYADLSVVATTCEEVLADLATVLPTDKLRSRVELSVLRRARNTSRVN